MPITTPAVEVAIQIGRCGCMQIGDVGAGARCFTRSFVAVVWTQVIRLSLM